MLTRVSSASPISNSGGGAADSIRHTKPSAGATTTPGRVGGTRGGGRKKPGQAPAARNAAPASQQDGRPPRRGPEEAGTGSGGQQAGPAQPTGAVAYQGQTQPCGNEREPGRVDGRNSRAHQRQQMLRAYRRVFVGQAGTSCHAVILRSRRRPSDRIRDASEFFRDGLQ